MCNRQLKKNYEKRWGIRLREMCEVMNPPEYRHDDFRIGQTISQVADCMNQKPNYILNEIRLGRLTATIVNRKVRIRSEDFLNWVNR